MKTILIFSILLFVFKNNMNNIEGISILFTISFFIDILFLNKPKKKGGNIKIL